MLTTWLYALASVLAVSLISLVGVFTLSMSPDRLRRIVFILVALAAGALFGDALIHLLPEIYATAQYPILASLLILLGIVIFLILEKILRWHHHHHINEGDEHATLPLGYLNLISDAFHNLLDGLVIGVSYLISPAVGLATTIAVIFHEIPQEIGDFGILIHAGFTRGRALFLNLLSALLAVVGVIVALLIGSRIELFNQVLLPLAAGGFLYIAGSDLVPEIHKTPDPRRSLLQIGAFIFGILLMVGLLYVEFK